MDQFIVKHPADIPSQDALALLAETYPGTEILSFRRVKSAGTEGDFYVATLRTAVIADQPDDVVLDDSDVVLEGKGHEEEEEEQMEDQDDKLDKIIDMLGDLIKKDEEVHKMVDEEKPEQSLIQQRPPVKNPVPMQPMAARLAKLRKKAEGKCECWDGYERVPGTKPCAPGSCKKCDSARKKSMVVVERDADVKKSQARLELLKEFGKEYKIARLAKTGSIYSATLVKRTAEGEVPIMNMRYNPKEREYRERKKLPVSDRNECDCCDDNDPNCTCDCHDGREFKFDDRFASRESGYSDKDYIDVAEYTLNAFNMKDDPRYAFLSPVDQGKRIQNADPEFFREKLMELRGNTDIQEEKHSEDAYLDQMWEDEAVRRTDY